LRILQFSTWKEACGIAGYTEDLAAALHQFGVRVEVHPINRRARKYLTSQEVLADHREFVRQARAFDVAHLQHEFGFFGQGELSKSITDFSTILRLLENASVPTVVTFHTQPPFHTSVLRVLLAGRGFPEPLRSLLLGRQWRTKIGRLFRGDRRAFRAVVCSKKARVSLVKFGFDPRSIEVIPIGMYDRSQRAVGVDSQGAKRTLGYPQDTVLLSAFGFVTASKGLLTAVNALRHLPANYHLAIVGGPHPELTDDLTLEHILKQTARDRRLHERIRVTGFADVTVVDLYHAATDICLAPYLDPSQAASAGIGWAISSGKPIIASKIPAFVEINERAESFLTFTPGAAHELAWHIERLYGDRGLQDRLTRNALRYAEDWSWGTVAKAHIDLYGKLLGACGRSERTAESHAVTEDAVELEPAVQK